MHNFFFIFYRLLAPFALLLAVTLIPFSKKLRRGLTGRLGLTNRIRKQGPQKPLWFHFSSAGEFEQCVGIIDEIKMISPTQSIFLSYFSPSAKLATQRETQKRMGKVPWDGADYSPFDLKVAVNAFVRALSPSLLVLVHREFWPELIATSTRHAPVCLVSTHFPRQIHCLLSTLLQRLRWIGTTDEGSVNFLRSLGMRNVEEIGDPRLERIALKQKKRQPWSDFFSSPVLVFGSIWEKDFEELRSALESLSERFRILLVPHEPNHHLVNKLLRFGRRLGSTRLWSQFLRTPDDHSHLVIDSVGVLFDLYGIATAAFVGNSFQGRVHNVAEPAVYGIPVFTGPRIQNSSEALTLRERGGLFVLDHGSELPIKLDEALQRKQEIRQVMNEFFEKQRGIAHRYARKILETMDRSQVSQPV